MISKSALVQVLGSPIAYYVSFAKVAGDVCAGVFVSQFFYWYGKGHDPEQWIYKTQSEIEEETGLTRRNQETARKTLKALGILEEKLEGLPAKLHYRLDIERLFQLVDELDSPKQTDQYGAFRHTGEAECANHSIYTETTTETTTESGASHRTHAAPSKQDLFFERMCWIVGVDWQTVSREKRGELNQAKGVLTKAGYTAEDLVEFWDKVWKRDFRWKDKKSRPTISQLRSEIGKVKTGNELPQTITEDNDTLTDAERAIWERAKLVTW